MKLLRIASRIWSFSSMSWPATCLGLASSFLALAALLAIASSAETRKTPPGNDPGNNDPPPAGAILDLDGTPIPGGGNFVYQMYSVSFTAVLPNTAITFAFREDPAFLYFSNASVTDTTAGGGNLLVNGDFSGVTYTNNGNTATPVGWIYANVYGATFGGVVERGCGAGPGGNYGVGSCWYDGAVQAYDAITQTIVTVPGHMYQISFWLADNSHCETYNGPIDPCNFSDLSTNGDTTDVGGNGIDLLVYTGAGLPAPDALHLEIGSDSALPTNPNQKMLAIATAMTPSGTQANMQDAASKMGFDHFNWLQYDITDSILTACAANISALPGCPSRLTLGGTIPSVPLPDPPLGGYAYEYWYTYCPGSTCAFSSPIQDYWPMYWDELFGLETSTVDGVNYTGYVENPSMPEYLYEYRQGTQLKPQVQAASPGQALGFGFNDRPNTAGGQSIAFETALVGVTGACNLFVSSNCGFQIFPGTTFRWNSTNSMVGSSLSPGSIPGGAAANSAPSIASTGSPELFATKFPDDELVNPVDFTGQQLANSLISIDEFLQLAGLTPETLADMGGGISIFSGSLTPSEAAALAAAQSGGNPPPVDSQVQVLLSDASITYPQGTVVTIEILPGSSPTHAPTGTVQLILDGTTLLATLNLTGDGHGYAAAFYYLPQANAGSHSLSAIYSGDARNPAGTSAPTQLQVAPTPVSLDVSCQNPTLLHGANYTCEIYTDIIQAGSGTFLTYQYDNAAPVSLPMSAGFADLSIPAPPLGPHTLVISYAAQGNYAAAASQTEHFNVIVP